RHNDLSSRGDGEDGKCERSDGRGRRATPVAWDRWIARGRCVGNADDHVRQYEHADGDDRGKRLGDDYRGCEIKITRRPRAGGDPSAVTLVLRVASVAFNYLLGGYGSPPARGRLRVC